MSAIKMYSEFTDRDVSGKSQILLLRRCGSNMYAIEMHSEVPGRGVSEEIEDLHITNNDTKKYKEKQFHSLLYCVGILKSK